MERNLKVGMRGDCCRMSLDRQGHNSHEVSHDNGWYPNVRSDLMSPSVAWK